MPDPTPDPCAAQAREYVKIVPFNGAIFLDFGVRVFNRTRWNFTEAQAIEEQEYWVDQLALVIRATADAARAAAWKESAQMVKYERGCDECWKGMSCGTDCHMNDFARKLRAQAPGEEGGTR